MIYLAMKILANVGEELATEDDWLEFARSYTELFTELDEVYFPFDISTIPYVATSFLLYVYNQSSDKDIRGNLQTFLLTHGARSMNELQFCAFFIAHAEIVLRHPITVNLNAFVEDWPSRMEHMLDNDPGQPGLEPVSFYTKADDEEWKKEFNWDK